MLVLAFEDKGLGSYADQDEKDNGTRREREGAALTSPEVDLSSRQPPRKRAMRTTSMAPIVETTIWLA